MLLNQLKLLKGLKNGFIHHYLTKPWSTHELQTAVKKALEAYKNNSWKDT